MKSSPEITAVVLCAGKGERAGRGRNKLFEMFDGRPIAAVSAAKFARFDRLVVAVAPDEKEAMRELLPDKAVLVEGGSTRTASVRNALAAIGNTDIVVIHDGARPFVPDRVIDDCIASAVKFGSGVAAVKSVDSLKIAKDGKATALDRERVFRVQTPQAFCFSALADAYARFDGDCTDDSEVFERAGYDVKLTEGSDDNRKLTTPADFLNLGGAFRVGMGYDVHPTVEGGKLVLCGARFDETFGLAGHSDADAPVHAVMDALLSAAGLPDIGVLFPDTDPALAGADSMDLLRRTVEKCPGFSVVNLSVCIMAERPKIAPRVPEMRANLASVLGVDADRVNVSATTAEKLGIVGEGKGIAAAAVILVCLK